jgi:DNA-binding NtrC family response regulator/tetratricopeptide (TPR) repeat protein
LKRDQKTVADLLINLGLLQKSHGDVWKALFYYDEALDLLSPHAHIKTRFRLFLNRGICLLKLGRVSEARESFTSAKGLLNGADDPIFTIRLYNNLGHVFRIERHLATALEFHEEALRLAREHQSVRSVCLSLEFLGETLCERGEPEAALVPLNEAYELARQIAPTGDVMMEVLRRRGEAKAALGQQAEAVRDLEAAIRLCRSRGELRELRLSERALIFAIPTAQFEEAIRKVLADLHALGDMLEYSRTIALTIESGRLPQDATSWLDDAVAAAMHFLVSSGCGSLKERLLALTRHTRPLARSEPPTRSEERLVSSSSLYLQAIESMRVAARGKEPVLILGETGTGKEIAARCIHSWSLRRDGPLVAVNCGALPESLMESELFGHVRGAFTGAERDKIGLLEEASGGSVLLDEIADLPAHTQVKLLRFLDTGEFRRVGDTKLRRSDSRVLAATNRDLAQLISQGRFRDDLFHRINVFRVNIPPLRRRRQDIVDLAAIFINEGCDARRRIKVSPALEQWMLRYDWPGNVRELRNVCRFLATHGWGKREVGPEDLPELLRGKGESNDPRASGYESEKRELERAQIASALQETGGKIIDAARLLGMGRNNVARKMREYGLLQEAFRPHRVE